MGRRQPSKVAAGVVLGLPVLSVLSVFVIGAVGYRDLVERFLFPACFVVMGACLVVGFYLSYRYFGVAYTTWAGVVSKTRKKRHYYAGLIVGLVAGIVMAIFGAVVLIRNLL